MKEIIKNIFIDNKFDIILLNQYENTFLAANYREECINFYLVVFLENIPTDFLENQVSELYYTIKGLEKGYDERMDKNLSMLICLHNKQDLEDKQLMKSVFDVEEDPYFFKKYVLCYTDRELAMLSEILENPTDSSTNIINNVVNDTGLFIEFKEFMNKPNKDLYHICSKLLIKIPIITFNKTNKKIEDLSLKIKEDLNEIGLFNICESSLKINEKNDTCVDDILKIMEIGDYNEKL